MDGGISIWVPVISILAGSVLTGTIQYIINRQNHLSPLNVSRRRLQTDCGMKSRQKKINCSGNEYLLSLKWFFCLNSMPKDERALPLIKVIIILRMKVSPTVNYPLLNLTDVSGDWRVLSRLAMYRIRAFPVLQNEAQRTIVGKG